MTYVYRESRHDCLFLLGCYASDLNVDCVNAFQGVNVTMLSWTPQPQSACDPTTLALPGEKCNYDDTVPREAPRRPPCAVLSVISYQLRHVRRRAMIQVSCFPTACNRGGCDVLSTMGRW